MKDIEFRTNFFFYQKIHILSEKHWVSFEYYYQNNAAKISITKMLASLSSPQSNPLLSYF